eukprot:CAMPEP_0170470620 /NCGR_PEP_ID=MMETSP0123-20130129/13026_1 /TAXON_ID=182087 /ORGANISM="Favella ehrenbergii, Strain Fehren 1" /LENGTH=83 /DNA_ID=CAMNT_0010737823 /DNA_START=216 /DNA_END=467 /DNA_ORIENTATION=+
MTPSAAAPTAPSSRPSGMDGPSQPMIRTERSALNLTPNAMKNTTPIQVRDRRTRAQRKGENSDTVGDLDNQFNRSGLKYAFEW